MIHYGVEPTVPITFGIVTFAMEGITNAIPVHERMAKPADFNSMLNAVACMILARARVCVGAHVCVLVRACVRAYARARVCVCTLYIGVDYVCILCKVFGTLIGVYLLFAIACYCSFGHLTYDVITLNVDGVRPPTLRELIPSTTTSSTALLNGRRSAWSSRSRSRSCCCARAPQARHYTLTRGAVTWHGMAGTHCSSSPCASWARRGS